MGQIILSLLFSLFAAEKPDTCSILYWTAKLEDITMYEQMRIDNVERIAREENQHSAQDFADDIGDKIRAIQRKIEEENRE